MAVTALLVLVLLLAGTRTDEDSLLVCWSSRHAFADELGASSLKHWCSMPAGGGAAAGVLLLLLLGVFAVSISAAGECFGELVVVLLFVASAQ